MGGTNKWIGGCPSNEGWLPEMMGGAPGGGGGAP